MSCLVKQCAWCLATYSRLIGGYVRLPGQEKIPGATHGICPECLETHFPDHDQLPPCPLPAGLDPSLPKR
jgi:hypothetical protein